MAFRNSQIVTCWFSDWVIYKGTEKVVEVIGSIFHLECSFRDIFTYLYVKIIVDKPVYQLNEIQNRHTFKSFS